MKLTNVSRTAILTLRSRAAESKKKNPILKDPMAEFLLGRLESISSPEEKADLLGRLPSGLTNHIAIRARKYDSIADDFISRNPSCTVVNLGCGLDTRYWRLKSRECRYIELDLPEVISLKRELLGREISYERIGCSVLDSSWIDSVVFDGNKNFLLLAEGLFMYLPKKEVVGLFKAFSGRFLDSRVVFEAVSEAYTRGFLKKLVEFKFRNELGVDAGSSYNFGLKNSFEIETYGSGIKVVDEWCYLEDPDVRPWIYRYLNFFFSRLQWTITASINEGK